MPWFEGSIRDAVATAKSRRAIFVVFVEGQDEASRSTFETLKSAEIGAKLQSEDFIVIKIESNGESFRQFSQIYHLVPVPSVFFIGNNGVPLEVIAGEVRSADLLRRIDDVLSRSGKSTPQSSNASFITGESNSEASFKDAGAAVPSPSTVHPGHSSSQVVTTVTPATPEAEAEEKGLGTEKEEEDVTGAAASAASADAGSEPEASPMANLEEGLKRARELIEAKKQQKKEDEEREARNRELERRRMGQEVQKARRQQMEQEALQAAEQIRKDRQAEQEARQRVLQQIAQDKAERAARQNKVKEDEAKRVQDEAKKKDMQAAARAADGARVQFRLPDGSTHTHVFPPDTPLSDVRVYASTHLQLPFRDFGMSMTFPRREFTVEDNPRTVTDLQLCPTAVILILPAHRGEVVSQPGYSSAMVDWFWTLLTPLLSLYAYMRGLLFTRGPPPPTPAPRPTAQTAAADTGVGHSPAARGHDSSSGQRWGRASGEGASVRRQGNIHRLANRQDSSDDENNTWNGNSTQQM